MSTQVDCVQEEFSKDLDQLKTARVDGLRETGDLQAIMRPFLQNEAQRIARKLGERHPRSQQLNARLKANLQIVNTLAVEREIYQIKVPEVAEDEALVHGRVVDENGRGIGGLVVCLVDERATPIRNVAGSTTDTTGYYAIALDPALTNRVCEKHQTGIFLAVFTSKGRLLYRQPKPLDLIRGARLVVGVSLNRSDLFEVGSPGKPPSSLSERPVF